MLRYERPSGQDHLQGQQLRAAKGHLQQLMHFAMLAKINHEKINVGEMILAPPADRKLNIQKMSQDQKHHEIGRYSTLVRA